MTTKTTTRTARTDAPKKAAPAKATPKAEAKLGDARAIVEGLRKGELRHTQARLQAIAEAGIIPPAPDFSAETHRRFRAKLAMIEKAVKAGDIAALEAITINPVSSSPKAMLRYRDAAIIALKAQAAAGKAPRAKAPKKAAAPAREPIPAEAAPTPEAPAPEATA